MCHGSERKRGTGNKRSNLTCCCIFLCGSHTHNGRKMQPENDLFGHRKALEIYSLNTVVKKNYLGVLYSSFFLCCCCTIGVFCLFIFLDFIVNHCLRRENASKVVCFPWRLFSSILLADTQLLLLFTTILNTFTIFFILLPKNLLHSNGDNWKLLNFLSKFRLLWLNNTFAASFDRH